MLLNFQVYLEYYLCITSKHNRGDRLGEKYVYFPRSGSDPLISIPTNA